MSKKPTRPKRMDGITHLTPEEKAERDARAQKWMNNRKIERVWEGCQRARYRAEALALSEATIGDGMENV